LSSKNLSIEPDEIFDYEVQFGTLKQRSLLRDVPFLAEIAGANSLVAAIGSVVP
jgi:hypothetical protein